MLVCTTPPAMLIFLSCENKVLTYLLTNLRRADRVWQTKQRFLLSSLGPLTFAFHEIALDLACKLSWELSHWVVSFISNLLQNYFSRFIQDCQSSPSFFVYLHFSMTISPTQLSDFSSFLAVIYTDKPVNRSKRAYALM